MSNFTYALPAGYDWDLKVFVKRVKTKEFAKTYKNKLINTASKLTSANCDKVVLIGGMLQAAYGANIGRQIEAKLKEKDFEKIAYNILEAVYYSEK